MAKEIKMKIDWSTGLVIRKIRITESRTSYSEFPNNCSVEAGALYRTGVAIC